MTTGKQIRAARQLVEWTAEELGQRARLTKECILGVERGETRPLPSTLDKITRALSDAGVVFNGDTGVNLVGLDLRILEGEDCYIRLLDDVFHTLRNASAPEALFICVDDALSPREVVEATARLKKEGIKTRFLSSEKAKRFDCPLEDYRLIPDQYYKNSVMVVYGDKVATLKGTNDSVRVVQDADAADMLRGLFQLIWDSSAPPKAKKGNSK